ncbi:MAG: C25 family cysteine peptidase [Acidobacteriota bacterium]
MLLVTNEQSIFQKRSDQLADKLSGEGFLPQKIYPASTEVSNEQHTADLLNSLGSGQLMVHFIGHGGRYIWRTGPPDIAKNHDLFTLDDLDKLPPSKKLPVIVSLTCYSAPFDHPTADSIGEKFLRLEDRGAIGVIAASWRNSPKVRWGTVIFDELTRPGATVGEALQRAKGQLRSRMFRETYNLLGDPAVPIAVPAEVLAAQQAAAELEETAQSAASGAATAPGL